MEILTVLYDKQYGTERFYPVSENGKVITKLMKAKTFTKKDLLNLKEIFEIEVKVKVAEMDDIISAFPSAIRTK